MSPEYLVYLSGPITGLDYETATNGWRRQLWAMLVKRGAVGNLTLLSPMRKKENLTGQTAIYENSQMSWKAIIARDMWDVKRADLIVLNIQNATRVSIGSMMEMAWAHMSGKPILLICNKNENKNDVHHHGWVWTMATETVTEISKAADFIEKFCSDGV